MDTRRRPTLNERTALIADGHVEIQTEVVTLPCHNVFIDREIAEPDNYRRLTTMLLNGSEQERFDIIINSPGGRVNTTRQLIECIRNSKSRVRAVIIGDCSSGASMIALNCHEILVLDSAEMMIHTAQYGTVGNAKNINQQVDFYTKQINKLLEETYSGFLTPKELEEVKNGVEYYFDAGEIERRVKLRGKYLENQARALEAKIKKAASKTSTKSKGEVGAEDEVPTVAPKVNKLVPRAGVPFTVVPDDILS